METDAELLAEAAALTEKLRRYEAARVRIQDQLRALEVERQELTQRRRTLEDSASRTSFDAVTHNMQEVGETLSLLLNQELGDTDSDDDLDSF